MDLGDEVLHAKYYGPAHTSGDSVIYFEKANVVHMGDLVFNRMNPYTDRPAGASLKNWIKVLDTVAEEYPADALYIFGHGKPEYGVSGEKEDLKVMRNYLTTLVEYVAKGVEKGLSKEEITDKQVLEGFEDFLYADFWTLPDNLGVAYEEVTQS
jgi:glyoxylase-like metal-dependent hydrolase (beta-lactamase superfamily II)